MEGTDEVTDPALLALLADPTLTLEAAAEQGGLSMDELLLRIVKSTLGKRARETASSVERRLKIVQMSLDGYSIRDISSSLGISGPAVSNHRRAVKQYIARTGALTQGKKRSTKSEASKASERERNARAYAAVCILWQKALEDLAAMHNVVDEAEGIEEYVAGTASNWQAIAEALGWNDLAAWYVAAQEALAG